MKYFLSLVFLVSCCLLCFGQQSIANPVSLGPILVNQTNLDRMSELCQWYQLTEQPSDDDFRAYRHDDGTLIKFKMPEDKTPYVEIHTTQSKKAIEKIVTEARYEKKQRPLHYRQHPCRKIYHRPNFRQQKQAIDLLYPKK